MGIQRPASDVGVLGGGDGVSGRWMFICRRCGSFVAEKHELVPEGVCGKCREGGEVTDKQSFPTGAVRDTDANKPRLDLLSWPELERISRHYANGAKHYGEFNWQKGIPSSRYLQSLLRHVSKLAQGATDEDHASAIVFNVKGIMYNQRAFMDNPEINDLPGWRLNGEEASGPET